MSNQAKVSQSVVYFFFKVLFAIYIFNDPILCVF